MLVAGGLRISFKTPQKMWNEYYCNLSSDKPQPAQVSEEMSRVPDSAGTCHALDIAGDTANFAHRRMNENENKLNLFEKSVQLIGGYDNR